MTFCVLRFLKLPGTEKQRLLLEKTTPSFSKMHAYFFQKYADFCEDLTCTWEPEGYVLCKDLWGRGKNLLLVP